MRKGIKVISPLKRGENFAAVYKFTLDNGFFYIGGTKKILNRIGKHRAGILDGTHAGDVVKASTGCRTITFEILERVENLSILGQREDYYLKLFWGDTLLLNRAKSANGGFKRRPEEIEKHRQGAYRSAGSLKRAAAIKVAMQKRMKENPHWMDYLRQYNKKKRVASFKEGRYLQTFESHIDAERFYGINKGAVKRVSDGLQLTAYGYSFKDVAEDGFFIEPPKFQLFGRRPGGQAVRVLVMDVNGNHLFECRTVTEAVQKTGVHMATIHKVCTGKQKTAKGYIFRRLS